MKRFALIALLLIGCGDASHPVNPASPSKPSVVSNRDDIWSNLADAINAGEVTSSTKLVLIVTHLRSVGKLTDGDVAAVRGLFADWDQKEFTVGKSEADKILTLPEKRVAK